MGDVMTMMCSNMNQVNEGITNLNKIIQENNVNREYLVPWQRKMKDKECRILSRYKRIEQQSTNYIAIVQTTYILHSLKMVFQT